MSLVSFPLPLADQAAVSGTSLSRTGVTAPSGERLVIIETSEGPVINAPTYGGVAATLIDAWTNTGVSNPRTSVYWAPADGTAKTLAGTIASSAKFTMTALRLKDFDSAAFVTASAKNGNVSSGASVAVASAVGEKVFAVFQTWFDFSFTPPAGWTTLFDVGLGSLGVDVRIWAGWIEGSAGTVTASGTWAGSTQWSAVAFSVKSRVPGVLTLDTPLATGSGQSVDVAANATSAGYPVASASCSLINQGSGAVVGPIAMSVGSTNPYSLAANFSGVPAGTYKAQVVAINTDGGTDTELSANYVINPITGESTVQTSGTITPTSFSVAEGQVAIGALSATLSGTVTWSVAGGSDAVRVNLTTGGVASFVTAPNFEFPTDFNGDNVYVFLAQATNGTDTIQQSISVTVTNVVETITPGTFNTPEGTISVGSLTTNLGGSITWAITGGDDAALFALSGAGALSFIAGRDFEHPTDLNSDNVYQVTVQASNASDSTSATISVTVTNVAEAPVAVLSADDLTIDAAGASVLTAAVTDPTGIDEIVWKMDGVEIARTQINQTPSVQIVSATVAKGILFVDSRSNGAHTFQVEALDTDGNAGLSNTLTVNVSLGTTMTDITTGLTNEMEIQRRDTSRAILFSLFAAAGGAPLRGASPTVRLVKSGALGFNNSESVAATGTVGEVGSSGVYAYMPSEDDVNTEGRLIIYPLATGAAPVPPIQAVVVTPYGAR